MDHVIDSLKAHLDAYLECIRLDLSHSTDTYVKLSHHPDYADCKAIVQAIWVLEKQYYGEKRTLSLSKLI